MMQVAVRRVNADGAHCDAAAYAIASIPRVARCAPTADL